MWTGSGSGSRDDEMVVAHGLDSYLGVALRGADGSHLGHLGVLAAGPLKPDAEKVAELRIFAARQVLYLVEPGTGKVGAWRIIADGTLAKLGEYPGLPRTVDGDHAPSDLSALGSPAGIDVL